MNDVRSVFDAHKIDDGMYRMIEISDILHYLHEIFNKTAEKYPQLIQVIPTIDLTLNWLLNIYDASVEWFISGPVINISFSFR